MALGMRPRVLLLMAALVSAIYGPTLRYGFLEHDDDQNIVKNPHLQSLTADELGAFWERPHLGLFIPVTYTYWAGGVAISRIGQDPSTPAVPNPGLFHFGNVLLHTANGYLVWLILCQFGASQIAALVGAMFFLLHPLQVEAVSWITGAKDLLCAFLSLSAVYVYIRQLNRKDKLSNARMMINYGSVVGLTILAILAKPAAVVVPLLMGFIGIFVAKRIWWRVGLTLALPLGVGVMIAKLTSGAQAPEGPLPVVAWWQRPFVAGDALLFYARKILIPFGYAVDYARRPDLVASNYLLCALGVLPALAFIYLLRHRRRFPLLLGSLVAFALLLAPNLGFLMFSNQFLTTVCDRYAYLAMVVPAFLVSQVHLASIQRFWPSLSLRQLQSLAVGICALFTVLSVIQVRYWANERALFQHSVDVEPNGVMALVGLGNDAANQKQWDDSIKYFSAALSLRPDWGRVHNNLGNSYINVNRLVEATESLKRAIAVFPSYPLAFNNLCGALARREMWEEATAACRQALTLAPDFYMSFQNLGYIAAKQGRFEEAERNFRGAMRIAPTDIPPRLNLIRILKLQSKWDKLAAEQEVLSRMMPFDRDLTLDLAETYKKLGRADQADRLLQKRQ
ncbi:MAG: tetratricopeptide repeat protein [Deltaproteobacteria bacterium]|nr:tetratricopeptide repeat protein [Deltaproteobacteria bacterium]